VVKRIFFFFTENVLDKYATMSTTSSSEDLHAITDEDMIWEDDETLAYNGSEEDLYASPQ